MALVYSCCFWFSLRLGGILIGVFSLVQATISLIIICIGCKLPQNVKCEITTWIKDVNLLYIGDLLEKVLTDPETYTPYIIASYCIYVLMCVLYIYGAYTCNNILMVAFILAELMRLITLSIIVTTLLLVLKQNTMDIGFVIGASVASGFILLGMFYLWVCAANLPILINEMEREQHQATIKTLQRLLETKNQRTSNRKYVNFDNTDIVIRNPFVIHVAKNKNNESDDVPHYSSFFH